jgi:hypothetical protein
MIDYRDMTVWQLQEEQKKIAAELENRRFSERWRVITVPSMPDGAVEIWSGPHRILVTNIG